MFMIDKAEVFNELSRIPIHESEERSKIYEAIQKMDGIDLTICGECKFWNEDNELCWVDKDIATGTKAHDWCSYGKRRGEK